MIHDLPVYVNPVFVAATLLTVFVLYIASHRSTLTFVLVSMWLVVQLWLGLTEFYTITDTFPPRFLLLGLPPFLLILGLFFSVGGREFIDSFNIQYLTYLHVVRVPVELVLYWLFLGGHVPELMTFEGRNFDILAGLSAPVVAYFAIIKKLIGKRALLAWNFICLGLLVNIAVNAVLSAPVPFQQFGFEQPNTAVLYFPFIWLPSCIVPIVFFAHVVTIRILLKRGIR